MANKADKLVELLEPLAGAHGLDLVDVEVAGTRKNPILRVFLDTPEGGITLDELAEAQSWVDAAIEECDPFQEAYTLEVSSPGIDRPLRRAADFERFAGQRCKVQLKPGQARSNFTGTLRGIQGDEVLVECDGAADAGKGAGGAGEGEGAQGADAGAGLCRLPLAQIRRARLVGEIDFTRHDFSAVEGDGDATTE